MLKFPFRFSSPPGVWNVPQSFFPLMKIEGTSIIFPEKMLKFLSLKTWDPKDYEHHRNLMHGAAMNAMVSKMSDEDVKAVALYINSMNSPGN